MRNLCFLSYYVVTDLIGFGGNPRLLLAAARGSVPSPYLIGFPLGDYTFAYAYPLKCRVEVQHRVEGRNGVVCASEVLLPAAQDYADIYATVKTWQKIGRLDNERPADGEPNPHGIWGHALVVQGHEAWPGHAFCGGPEFTYHVVFFAVKAGKEELILHARDRENLLRQIKDSDRLNTIEEAVQITSAVWNL